MKIKASQKIGEVSVDAGCIWVGDPCLIVGDRRGQVPDWDSFVKKLDFDKRINEPLGEGWGMCIDTGGDGGFPVYANTNDKGEVTSIEIKFLWPVSFQKAT